MFSKVKTLVTTRRVTIITACVFVILIASVAPIYVINRLEWQFLPDRNKTQIVLVFSNNRDRVEKISFAFNNTFVSAFSFVVIAGCTITLVIKLQSKTKWREKATANTQSDNASRRNQKTTKMVVMISVLFIACFVRIAVIFVVMTVETRISIDGTYRNTAMVLGGLGFMLESINSSTNIFIYYYMSSKYRATFQQIFVYRQKRISWLAFASHKMTSL